MDLMVMLLFIIVITILSIIYAIMYNYFQGYVIKINEAESNIDNALRAKFDMLTQIYNNIKKDIKDISSAKLDELQGKKLSNFEIDRRLTTIRNDIDQLKDDHPKLSNNEYLHDMLDQLDDLDDNLLAYRHYYNDNITQFNKLVKIFPTNIVGKIAKLKEKTFYDGKDLTDKNVNDFKL